jgi:ubiquinone/menaquinone biosynthesis C-methylase UbiE
MANLGTKKPLSVWESRQYYHFAGKGSRDVNHPGMRILLKLAKNAQHILDLGCGDGTRLNIVANGKDGTGVDISSIAIKLAGKSFKDFKFVEANLENLPLKDQSFDLVYSAYVLEHLNNPERVIKEALRVVKQGGKLVFIAPNFGAPNRASPVFKGSRVSKLFVGFIADLGASFRKWNMLGWNKVTPKASVDEYTSDADTQVEPYLNSLIHYLNAHGMEIEFAASCWEEELKDAGLHQKLFRILSYFGIYPFTHWGPHLVVVATKL